MMLIYSLDRLRTGHKSHDTVGIGLGNSVFLQNMKTRGFGGGVSEVWGEKNCSLSQKVMIYQQKIFFNRIAKVWDLYNI